ncbi:PAS domain-containing protein [Hymenobacter rubidus]|uniref:PAS domain-containing protein n=1 Tax=Hymenobacter rubidus TaxID=1441626 RepID=UPI00191EA009|nr:PAS domain-containing protein [Hymenobacter rubidus]
MPASSLPFDLAGFDDFSLALLEVALTGFILFRPVYDATGATITDLAYEYLNPAAQQMLRLPQRPAESFLTLFPTAAPAGIFAFYRDAFLSGEPKRESFNYQHDSLDGYFHLAARRQGARLLVSFTDTNDQPRSAVEDALRQSQARELAARAEAEAGRQRFYDVLMHLPALVAVYEGSELVYTFTNATYQRYFPAPAQLFGRPLREVLPEAEAQGVAALLERVYRTGEPYYVEELEVWLDFTGGGQRSQQVFLNLLLHPLRDAQGRVNGVLDYSHDVSEQVRARQQLKQLNDELEMRVTARSAEARAALHEAEHQREQLRVQQGLLRQILGQVPAAIATLSGPEHRYTFFNDQYQARTGGRTALGRTVAQAVPELKEQGFIALLDQVYATGQPFSGAETALMLPDPATGQPVQHYVDLIYQPLFNGQPEPQGILVFILDVTEKVRARKQADTLQTAMLAVVQRQAQQRQDLYQIFEQTPVAIVLLREPDHRIDYFNPAFTELFPGFSLQRGGKLR